MTFIDALVARLERITGPDSDRDQLRADRADAAAMLKQINAALVFTRWAISEGPWQGGNLEGGEIQQKAVELGLITKTEFDPTIHGESDVAEPGDPWFVFSPLLSASTPSHEGDARCTCGQSGHGNAHEPGCPRSDYKPTPRPAAVPEIPQLFAIDNDHAICFNPGGRFHGWTFWRHLDGQWVSVATPNPIESPKGLFGETLSASPTPTTQGRPTVDLVRALVNTLTDIFVEISNEAIPSKPVTADQRRRLHHLLDDKITDALQPRPAITEDQEG